jgi:hypothetical protein
METTSSERKSLDPSMPTYSSNNAMPQEIYKLLFGWLDPEWAFQARSSLITDTPENHTNALMEAQAHVTSRPAFTPSNPVTELSENEQIQAIKARPEFAYIQAEIQATDPTGTCRIAMVNLSDVLAIQPSVRIDNLQTRIFQSAPSEEQLLTLCFPPNEPSDAVSIDVNDRGYTVTALDPNVRVVPWNQIPHDPPLALPQYKLQYPGASSPLPMQIFPFALLRMPNYLQITHYQDRYILRNGYNRAVALLYQNIQNVPCVLIETQEEDLIGFKPGMLDPEIVLGDYPPRLDDFWRDAVTCLGQTTAKRRIYHMTLEEIRVWR